MWFASHLCEKGIITSDQFAEAVRFQLSRQTALGTLATRKGLLTVKQVFQILSENALEPDRCFGQTAIELGFITHEELAVLLYEQSKETPDLNKVLVELGFVTHSQIARELHLLRGDKQFLSTMVPAYAGSA